MKVNNRYKEHSVFMDSVVKLTNSRLAPHLKDWEKAGRFPNDVFSILGDAGYLGMLISEEYGGIGGDYALAAAWCEAFGTLCDVGLGTGVNMHALVIAPAVDRLGTPEAKARWLPDAITGKAIGAYAFTEPGAGSDLASLRTKAERQGDRWIINGSKIFITNGARADFVLVLTRTDPSAGYKGFTTFVVDTKSKGFKVNKVLDKLGWKSSDTAELTFENVEVDDSCILGKVGDGWSQAAYNLNWERLMLTLTTIAGTRECIKQTAKYAQQRQAFGKNISELAGVRDLLFKMIEKFTIGEALTYVALDKFLNKEECRAEVSAAKRIMCEDALWIADKAIQIHGGYGYTTEFLPEKWWRELRLMTIGGGTSEIMGTIVKKELQQRFAASAS